ncbi:MAG: hypothetical protein LBT18_05970 [Endomicrobium sp.]|jgi:hypothetical protein|nr:hypothetical protein [Endomicrobium sp.]
MKKLILLSVMFLLCSFSIISCGQLKKLIANKLSVSIEPSEVEYMSNGSVQTFESIVKNARGEKMDVDVLWNFTPSSLGTLSTSSGKTVVFTADPVSKGSGTLFAEYSGVKRSISIEISNAMLLYRNGKVGNNIDVDNLNTYSGGPGGAGRMHFDTVDDNGTCWQFSITMGSGQYGGFYMQFLNALDLSSYKYLKYSAKVVYSDSGTGNSVNLNIIINDEAGNAIAQTINGGWNDYEIDLNGTGISLTNVLKPFNIYFVADFTGEGTYTIRINNIRFERD